MADAKIQKMTELTFECGSTHVAHQSQDKLIRNQADLLNNYSAELKRLKPAWKESEK